jgi:4-amino-4-deoxy-L-arabinose transferase-like glycosyltransferase
VLTENHYSKKIEASLGVLLLLLCSSLFAFYKSNTAFNTDEVWSIKTASANYDSRMAALAADVHPPLYFEILHQWIRAFGTGERTVRSLSGLFYILSVLAVFGIGRQIYGTRTALLCAAIYLSSPLAVLAAQFARMYSLLSLLAILSTWLYLQFSIRLRGSRALLILYVVVNILGTFTHIAFFFLLFAQIVVQLLFYRRSHMKRFVVAITASLLPYVSLWGPMLMRQLGVSREGVAWVKKPGFLTMGDLLLQYGGTFWLVLPLFFYLYWRRRARSENAGKLLTQAFPIWLLLITLFTPFLISFFRPVFNSRLAIVALHLFALSIAAFIGRRANLMLTVAVIVLSIAFLPLVHPVPAWCDNRQVADYLGRNAHDGDVVIFTSLTRLPIDYYLERTTKPPKLFETTFPAEVDYHPGYEGRTKDPARRAALEREALELVEKIRGMKFERIIFLHGLHPETDTIVQQHLAHDFKLQSNEGMKCDEALYFKEVSIYSR